MNDISMIRFKPDVKHVLDCIDNLTPWDRADLYAHIITENECSSEFESILQSLGYVDFDSVDLVKEVKRNDLSSEVLDEMTDWEIGNYVSNHPDIIDEIDVDDIVEAFHAMERIEECLTTISKQYPEEFEKWLEENPKIEKKVTYKFKKD